MTAYPVGVDLISAGEPETLRNFRPYAVREGSFHPQRNIITHATRSSSTESRTFFAFTAHLAVMVQRLRRCGVIYKRKQKGQHQ